MGADEAGSDCEALQCCLVGSHLQCVTDVIAMRAKRVERMGGDADLEVWRCGNEVGLAGLWFGFIGVGRSEGDWWVWWIERVGF